MDPDIGHSYQHYIHWDLIPCVVVSGAIVFFIYVWTMNIYCDRQKSLLWEELVLGVAKLILEFKEIKHDGKTMAIVRNRRVSVRVMEVFFMIALVVMGFSFVTFWAIFMFDETFACDSGLDCFGFDKDSGNRISDLPLGTNCSEFESRDNVTITCYIFVFRYAEGFGAAGGIIVFAGVMLKVYAAVFFRVFDSQSESDPCCFCRRCAILFLRLSPFLFASFWPVSLAVPIIRNTVGKTTSGIYQFSSYILSLTTIALFGLIGFTKIAVLPKNADPPAEKTPPTEKKPPTETTPLIPLN